MPNVPTIENKEIECPFCKKGKINVTIKSEYYSYHTSHISAKNQKIPVYHPERIEVNSSCPNCGKSKAEIKEAIKQGTLGLSHEDRVKRLRDAGIPTRIEG